jgi:hypothetical protein
LSGNAVEQVLHGKKQGVACMKMLSGIALLLLLAALALGADQPPAGIPLNIEYGFLQQALIKRLYTQPDQEMVIWTAGNGCSKIILADPRIDGLNDLLRITNRTVADFGLPIGSECVPVYQWSGTIETYHSPRIDSERTALRFEIVAAKAYNADMTPLTQGREFELLKQFAGPRLAEMRVDLQPELAAIRQLLPEVIPENNIATINEILDSLSFTTIDIKQDSLEVVLEFSVDSKPPVKIFEPPLTKSELDRWEQTSQQWDAFLTYTVKQIAARSKSDAVRETLLDLLIETRYDILMALSDPATQGADPVRRMFVNVWSRLAPLLREVSHDLQGDLPLQYMTFIAAGDMLQILDRLGPDFGLEITADGLRRMARMLVPDDKIDPLEYNLDIDPALRKLFGLEPQESADDQLPVDTLSWIIKSARASTASAALRHKLKNWVPARNEISEYLSLVHQLLNETMKNTISPGKLDSIYEKQYHDMLLATAWQESCWRQFIRTDKGVKTITSSTGSVGIMQVNRKVWRGLYDAGKLETEIAYNAHAGSEILLHYFRDYALKKELGKSNAVDSLARATYATYNGGPRHLTRYRESTTPEQLRKIDASFWEKYKKIKGGDIKSVAGCYGETADSVIANSTPAKSNKTTKSTSRPAGLLQSNPDNYTIQLMSSRNKEQMVKYIQENKLAGKAEYYTYRHNNETWYGLVYGSFATRTAAETRAQSLKKSMGLSGTWVRQISSVQKLE